MKRNVILILIMGFYQLSWAQKNEFNFAVHFKGEQIGTMHAVESKTGAKSVKDLRTNTDAKIFGLSIHVESEVTTTHEGEILTHGIAYRHASRKSEEVHAQVTKVSDKVYQKERNGIKEKLENIAISFCVIDLYFREPKGIKKVFSNMYADMLQVKELGQGRYEITAPDDRVSYYQYANGKLLTMEASTPLGKIVSKRL